MAVLISNDQHVPVDTDDLVALARHVLEQRRVSGDVELSMVLVDREAMADLNRTYLDRDGPTDVLAFPMDEPAEQPPGGTPVLLGDVALSPAVAADQAENTNHDLQSELRMLTVHGILHLLGMDHADPTDEREMFGLTDQLLESYSSRGDAARKGSV